MSDLLGAVARAYGMSDVRLVEEARANILHVATGDTELAVKCFDAPDHARAVLEAQLLAHLSAPHTGYRVQSIVPAGNGDALARLGESTVLVTRWEPGRFKPYTEITEVEWAALGNELAAMHARLDSFVGELPRLSDAIRTRDLAQERAALEALVPSVPDEVRTHIATMLALVDARGARASAPPTDRERPIHNDYNQYNYLFDGLLPPIILDWEGAIAAPREYEVVRCMNHLPLVAPGCARAFVGGYQQVRALDAESLRWAIDASLVDHATKRWPIERLVAGHANAEQVMRGSMEVLRALSARAHELEDFYLR